MYFSRRVGKENVMHLHNVVLSVIKEITSLFFFSLPGHLGGWSWLGAVPHLRQEDGGSKEDEKVSGVDQLSAPACYEKWEVRAGIQTDSEDDQTGQSEIGDPRQQLPRLEEI